MQKINYQEVIGDILDIFVSGFERDRFSFFNTPNENLGTRLESILFQK